MSKQDNFPAEQKSDGLDLGVGRIPPQAVQQDRQSGKVPEQNDKEPVRYCHPERLAGNCVFIDFHTAFPIKIVIRFPDKTV